MTKQMREAIERTNSTNLFVKLQHDGKERSYALLPEELKKVKRQYANIFRRRLRFRYSGFLHYIRKWDITICIVED